MRLRFFSLIMAVMTLSSFGASQDFIPVEALFENSEFKSFQVSPDGEHLIAIAPYQGVDNLFVLELESMRIQLLTDSNKDIGFVSWVNNERIVYGLSDDKDDARSSAGGLVALNIDGKDKRVLIQPYGAQNSRGVTYKPESISVISGYTPDEDWIIIESNKRRQKYPDVYRMNVYNGKRKTLFFNPGRIHSFISSPKGNVALGIRYGEEGEEWKKIFLKDSYDEWNEIFNLTSSSDIFDVIGIEDDGETAYVIHNIDRDKAALYKMDLQTGIIADEPILEDAIYDVSPFEVFRTGGVGPIAGIAFHREFPTHFFLRKEFSAIQKQIDSLLPGRFNHFVNSSKSGLRIVIESFSDVEPPFYSLIDLDKGQLVPLSRINKFKDKPLCETKPVSWEARDGRRIHGYLTLPHSWEKGSPVPMIVRPHGGPWARETWGLTWHFPMERQFYANRGFAVLEVNFRGSTGYGRDHLESSFKHLKEMHTDFVDGTLWAIDEGYAEPGKIGMGGASWGGYATMVGVTKFPEIYSFGINFMGVVDLVRHIDRYIDWDRKSGYVYWCNKIGDPEIPEDREQLEAYSPINYIDAIKGPVFIYHGLDDYNVHIEQARMLIDEMKDQDMEFTKVLRTDEAHSTHFEDDRIETYKEIDMFLSALLKQWD